MDRDTTGAKQGVDFGPFRLFAAERLLEKEGVALALSSRAFDILIALVERAGEVVTKNDLISRAWPNLTVDESNLRVHVASLRKTLGDGQAGARYVTNIPGRGYCFVAPVAHSVAPKAASIAEPVSSDQPYTLPPRLTRMVGRDEMLRTISEQLAARRFVTIHGTGGIGKTTVAVAVGHNQLAAFGGAVRFADLGPLCDPRLVPSALASALGLLIQSDDPIRSLINYLRNRRMLLILDSCEHVVETAAALAERIFHEAPLVSILATSREALRVEGEHVLRLSALDSPPEGVELSAAQVLTFPAAHLFVERAAAGGHQFELTDADASIVAEICRKLDGIALAIELVAGRASTLGLHETAALLDDRLRLLWHGRRTALPRHQTLNATLDWSHDLITDVERAVLRRLSVFAGTFTLQAARAVASDEAVNGAQVVEALAELLSKSLVSANAGGTAMRYRLLDTTRAYALEKLRLSGERDETARRHAEYHRDLLEQTAVERDSNRNAESLPLCAEWIGDVHAALDWASSPGQDATVAAALTVAAVPLWLQLSLIDEGLCRTKRAMAALEAHPHHTPKHSMELYAALARLQLYSVTNWNVCRDTWAHALRLAEELEDTDYQLHILWGAYAGAMSEGRFAEALDIANRFRRFADASGRAEQLIGHRMIGSAVSRLGDQVTARAHTELMLNNYFCSPGRPHSLLFGSDQRALARGSFARILWLQGFPDQAMREVKESCELIDDDVSVVSHRLVTYGCPIALWTGDIAEAERYSDILRQFTSERAYEMRSDADCTTGEVFLANGDAEGALSLLEPAVDALRQRGRVQHLSWQLSVMARALACLGRTAEALRFLEEALARCERTGEGWCRPELLRIKAEVLLQRKGDAATAIGPQLAAALDLARQQGARSWELRVATSLARLRLQKGYKREALAVLKPVYDEFTEGFATADLRAASMLLRELA